MGFAHDLNLIDTYLLDFFGCVACGIDRGENPGPLPWKRGALRTGSPGNSPPPPLISHGSRQLCPENIALGGGNIVSFLSAPKLQVKAKSKLNL